MTKIQFNSLPIVDRATILVNDDIANGEYGESLREKMIYRYVKWFNQQSARIIVRDWK